MYIYYFAAAAAAAAAAAKQQRIEHMHLFKDLKKERERSKRSDKKRQKK